MSAFKKGFSGTDMPSLYARGPIYKENPDFVFADARSINLQKLMYVAGRMINENKL